MLANPTVLRGTIDADLIGYDFLYQSDRVFTGVNETIKLLNGDDRAIFEDDLDAPVLETVSFRLGNGDDYFGMETWGFEDLSINGDAGNDTLLFIGSGEGLDLRGGNGNDTIGVGYAVGVDIRGGNGNDTIFLDGTQDHVVRGGKGDDIITSGYVSLDGSTGFSLTGGGQIYGEAGNDVVDIQFEWDGQSWGSIIDGGTGDDQITTTRAFGVSLIGGSGEDIIKSEEASSTEVWGGGGDDVLFSGNGMDIDLFGGGGDDFIFSELTDTNDYFEVELISSQLSGWRGADHFVVQRGVATGTVQFTITDYSAKDGDQITVGGHQYEDQTVTLEHKSGDTHITVQDVDQGPTILIVESARLTLDDIEFHGSDISYGDIYDLGWA